MKSVSGMAIIVLVLSTVFVLPPKARRRIVVLGSTPIVVPTGNFQRRMFSAKLQRYKSLIEQASEEFDVPVSLIAAVIRTESSFDPYAVSSAGAMGLMQLMPETWDYLDGKGSPYNPGANIRFGTKYLRELLNMFRGNVGLAVAAYNAGPGAVKRFRKIPPYCETRRYVRKVLSSYRKFRGLKDFG